MSLLISTIFFIIYVIIFIYVYCYFYYLYKIKSWSTWGCGVSKFPWSYDSTESSYFIKGKVIVTPTNGGSPVTIEGGDFVVFPSGLDCVWDVKEDIFKHYSFS